MLLNKSIHRKMESLNLSFHCIYCNITFLDKVQLRAHCQSEAHEMVIMSDEGRDWIWRTPPRGFNNDMYKLCQHWEEVGSCRFGYQCVEAHGNEELEEWRQRFNYRQMKLQRATDKELYGKSYAEEFLEKVGGCTNCDDLMKETLHNVEFSSTLPLSTIVESKNSENQWTLFVKTRKPLRAVALLQDAHRNFFSILKLSMKNVEIEIKNDQEWISPVTHVEEYKFWIEYKIKVRFKTEIFGTFRQSIVFDFYSEPVLVKHFCVDVVPDIEKLNEIRKEISSSLSTTNERWIPINADIVGFKSAAAGKSVHQEWEENLTRIYPCPDPGSTDLLSSSTLSCEKMVCKNNYRQTMHDLLYIEEIARYELIARYNITTKLLITHSYMLSPNSMAVSTAKYSINGELFASISLGKKLSEDTSEGRLILMHCHSVLFRPTVHCDANSKHTPRRAYEALIEDKGKETIYLRLSSETVRELKLLPDSEMDVEIQFQLNRIPYCQWHYVLDKISSSLETIFPETFLEPIIPWSPSRQWSNALDPRLNLKQKEAIVAITTSLRHTLPPILVIGPFGTGKTFTLAQAIKELIKEPENKILLCTHSNSAADLYVVDYFHPLVEAGNENARPLRIYYEKRWVNTVNTVVQKYCPMIRTAGCGGGGGFASFRVPTKSEIDNHKIVVATLSTSVYLTTLGIAPGYFTHILIDEAAQAIECETITPLILANKHTRIVLVGDHMQLGPDIFSKFARKKNLHISLLERLYDHYPAQFSCKILLVENYRAHDTIIGFTSESFYDQKLVASSKQPVHPNLFPLSFFTTQGDDIQDQNSTGYYNYSEVYEVIERILELKRTWTPEWGPLNDQSIGVVTPYADQVYRIRSELRKKRIDENVCVERVLNVQGKQFRVIIISAVRTRRTCSNEANEEADYGFLSNSKLLNTAITRAQSLVAVVGDPIALCSVGRCSKVWERFIQICQENNSLFGITKGQLKLQLDGIELKKIYTLNPLAPEFYPKTYRPPPPLEIILPPAPILPVAPTLIPVLPSAAIAAAAVAAAPPPPPPTHIYYNVRPVAPCPNISRPPSTPIPATAAAAASASIKPPQTTNKLIQFMSNVHFPPEAQVLSDCVNLLPQNMSLADMLQQPPNLQEQWYKFLRDSAGAEAAEKFKYLLHSINQKGSRPPEGNVFFKCESPTFNWFDNPTNQINYNKPIYMRNNNARRTLEIHHQRKVNEEFAANLHNGGATSAADTTEASKFANPPFANGGPPRFYQYFN